MSTVGDVPVPSAKRPSRHPLIIALAVLIFAECALLLAAVVYLVVELLIATPASLASALFLTILTAIAAVWLGVIGVNVLRASTWVRGAAIVWQVLQLAVAVGSFQGLFAQPAIGWALLVPAVIGLVLVFTPAVVQATRREG
ncbi:MAG: hypothetical protein ABL886_01735 [Rhodoglobus sp.]